MARKMKVGGGKESKYRQHFDYATTGKVKMAPGANSGSTGYGLKGKVKPGIKAGGKP